LSIAEKKNYCKVLANHLRYISGLLKENGIVKDISPILSAATMYQRSLNMDLNVYEAIIDQLIFHSIDPEQKFRKIRPKRVHRGAGLDLEYNISLKGNLPVSDSADPLSELAIGFKLTALSEDNKLLVNSWHIDRHITGEGENSYFPHPVYHIQYGGKTMTEDEGIDHGDILLVDTPRVPCPPHDIALSIDYILCNYYGRVWYQLKEDDRYNDAIKYSRKCFWYAYFKSISDSFETDKPVNKGFMFSHINPQLI
jgi:hypothetical protein